MKLFQNLFKAKWKNKNPEIRKNALLTLDPDSSQEIFIDIAKNDEIPEIRLLTVKRINNLAQLELISRENTDPKVREQAHKLVCQAYAQESESSIHTSDLLEKLSKVEDQKILEYVAKNGTSTEIRHAAMEKISRDALLGDLATTEQNPELRLLVAKKIQQKSTLERLYKKIKTRDKVLSNLVKNKIDEITRAEQEPQLRLEQQKQICLQLENLGNKGLWERDKLQFDHLLKQWDELVEHDPEYTKRFEKARTAFNEAYQAYLKRHEERLKQEEALIPVKEEKQALISQLHELLRQLKSLPEENSAREIEQKLSELKKSWQSIKPLPAEIEEEFLTQYNDVSSTLKNKLKQHIQNQELIKTFQSLIKELEIMVSKPGRLNEKSLVNIEKRFKQTFTLSGSEEASKLKSKTSVLIQKAETELGNKESKIAEQLKQLKSEISAMETKLNEGILKDAIATRKNVNDLLESLEKLGYRDLGEFKRKLSTASARINELANWRSWANTPQKEELCQRVEALIGSNEHPTEVASIIQRARNEWKKLGPSERDTSQQLWERFQAACDAAYEPCKAYFAEESKQKQANYEKRLAFVEDLEKFIDTADWENIDWKKVESLFRHSRNEWKNLGQTDAKQRKALNKRFYAAFETIKNELNKEWTANKEIKQKIVEDAKALESLEELDTAIARAKELQAQWKKAGRIPQSLERELWSEFRNACDVVFNRREALKEQEKQELSNLSQQKVQLCNELDSICQLPLDELFKQRGDFERKLQEFKNFGETIRREDEKLEKRLDEILHVFERKIESANRRQTVKKLETLQKVIVQIEKLEQTIESNLSAIHISEQVEAARNALENADNLLPQWEKTIESRLQNAINIASSQNFAETLMSSIRQAADDKQVATIQLEIIGNVETPKEFANDRLNIQAQRLSDKLQNHEEVDHWQAFLDTESRWWLCGPTAQSDLEQFKKRRAAVVDSLKNEYPEELKDYK